MFLFFWSETVGHGLFLSDYRVVLQKPVAYVGLQMYSIRWQKLSLLRYLCYCIGVSEQLVQELFRTVNIDPFLSIVKMVFAEKRTKQIRSMLNSSWFGSLQTPLVSDFVLMTSEIYLKNFCAVFVDITYPQVGYLKKNLLFSNISKFWNGFVMADVLSLTKYFWKEYNILMIAQTISIDDQCRLIFFHTL